MRPTPEQLETLARAMYEANPHKSNMWPAFDAMGSYMRSMWLKTAQVAWDTMEPMMVGQVATVMRVLK